MIPRMPAVPSPEDLKRHEPAIEPVATGVARPLWSVMIPTYNGDDYLRVTLRSVLDQDPGPAAMQIEVVDDASTRGDPAAVARGEGGGRVAFHRNPRNLGATETFNVCLRRARGRWVHVLHGDDAVLPGFYAAYRRVIERHPALIMLIGQVVQIDERGHWIRLLGPSRPDDDPVLPDFTCRQAYLHLGQFAGWVTRRDALEKTGGFSTLFRHAADMDLAFRLGLSGPVGCVARPYALYRVHSKSDTSKLMVSGRNLYERALATRVNLSRVEAGECAEARGRWRTFLAGAADHGARQLDAAGSTEGRLNQAAWAFALEPTRRRAVYLARSWAKHRLRPGDG